MNQFSSKGLFKTGTLSLDALFSILPTLLIIFYILNTNSILLEKTTNSVHTQILFDKLTSIGDYVVEILLSKKTENARHPNFIHKLEVGDMEKEKLKTKLNLQELSINNAPVPGVCVYRLVLLENPQGTRNIKQIYICGR